MSKKVRAFPEMTEEQEEALKEEARQKSKQDLHYLAKHLLGYDRVTDHYHKWMCMDIDNPNFRFKLLLHPRGHFKSTLGTESRSIQLLLRNPNERILITNAKLENARKFLRAIAHHWKNNSKFRWVWRDWWLYNYATAYHRADMGDKLDWVTRDVQDEFTILRPYEGREASITTSAVDASVVSQHYCLFAGSKVLTSRGLLPVEEVREGHRVLTKEGTFQPVKAVEGRKASGRKVRISPAYTSEATELTDNHRVMVYRNDAFQWVEARELTEDDRLVVPKMNGRSGAPSKTTDRFWVTGITELETEEFEDEWVYDIQVDGDESFYCPGMIVHNSTIIADDLINREFVRTQEMVEKSILYFKDILDLLDPDGRIEVIGCLTGDSKVLMADTSWKPITEVEEGEYVWSYEDKKAVKRKVTANIPQGKDDVYEIKTARHSIKANERHPFLVVRHSEDIPANSEHTCNQEFRRNDWAPEGECPRCDELRNAWREKWVKVKDLKPGDKVLTVARVNKDNYTWWWDRVKSIEWSGREEVYDLTVEGSENFIANGYVVHNTRWSHMDLYNWIIEEFGGVASLRVPDNYLPEDVVERSQQTPEEEKEWMISIQPVYKEDGNPVFPEEFNAKVLRQLEDSKGPYEFGAQYLLNPTPTEHQKFREEWFHQLDVMPDPSNLDVCMTVDPAKSLEDQADKFAITICGYDDYNRMYLLDGVNERLDVEQGFEVAWEYAVYYYNKAKFFLPMGFEAVGFQETYIHAFQRRMMETGTFIPIYEQTTNKPGIRRREQSKEERILRLVPRIKYEFYMPRRLPKVPYNKEQQPYDLAVDLRWQLLNFPFAGHDDLADALADQLEIVQAHRLPSEKPPEQPKEERDFVHRSILEDRGKRPVDFRRYRYNDAVR